MPERCQHCTLPHPPFFYYAGYPGSGQPYIREQIAGYQHRFFHILSRSQEEVTGTGEPIAWHAPPPALRR